MLVLFSFNQSKLNIVWTGFTFDWYASLWSDTVLVRALQNSLIVAVFTTLISLVLGTAGAWLLYRYRYRAAALLETLSFLPMIVPEVILGVSLLILFVTIGLQLGYTTIVISHVTFCFPFVMASVQARLAGLDPALEEAALDLGATPLQAFTKVLVPYLMPAIVSGGLMSFTLSLDELIVTYFTASAGNADAAARDLRAREEGPRPVAQRDLDRLHRRDRARPADHRSGAAPQSMKPRRRIHVSLGNSHRSSPWRWRRGSPHRCAPRPPKS